MSDPIEEVVAPAAIERALGIYQQLRQRDQSVYVQPKEFLADGQMNQNYFGALAIRRSNESVLRLSEAKRVSFIA